jgi:methylenetetrahydrofolate dehydrogenase (NADP+)/methenyltetrahydrofolate cyclohydrolase
MDADRVRNGISAGKDVDGITDLSMSGVFSGSGTGYPPCPAQACIEILDHYSIDITGRKAAVIGRSLVAGRPVSMLLLERNATVTICHTGTKDMAAVCREADILVVSAGRAGMIGRGCLREGQVVIDVGINVREDGTICGDVDYAEACRTAGAVTPVPGGVGAVTTAVLASHVVAAAECAFRKMRF